MDDLPLSKRTTAFGLAVAIACMVNAVIVVFKEKSDAVMKAMKSVLGHHWTTHAALVIALFFVLGWLFAALRGGRGPELAANTLIGTIVSGVVLAGMIIVGFYLFAD
jgi:hypothetical protein